MKTLEAADLGPVVLDGSSGPFVLAKRLGGHVDQPGQVGHDCIRDVGLALGEASLVLEAFEERHETYF